MSNPKRGRAVADGGKPAAALQAVPVERRRSRRDDPANRVFDSLPYGVVLVRADRSVIAANPAARRFLWGLEARGGDATCDSLFDCRAPGGPCEHGCLATRAIARQDRLPEIRIDTASGGSVTALWVTAAPLAGEPVAVLHLRPGDARDRRRRSDPHWLTGPELRITSFGRMRLDSPEGPLGGQWLRQRPGQVLKYLVCERNRVVPADEIAETLWPGAGLTGLNNVRYSIHQLRDQLEPMRERGARSSFVVTVQGGYAINRRRVQIDADDFEEAVAQGLEAAARGDAAFALQRLRDGLAVYGGEFLADEPYSDWAHQERERLRALAGRALRALTRIMLARHDLDGAVAYLEQLAELDPFDSDVQRDLLAVLLAQGRRTEAARRYAVYRARMLREFGEEPDFHLADLRAALAAV